MPDSMTSARLEKELNSLDVSSRIRMSATSIDHSTLIQYWVAWVLSQSAVWKEAAGYRDEFDHPEFLTYLDLNTPRIRKRRTPPTELQSFLKDVDACFKANLVYHNLSELGEKLSLTETETRLLTLAVHCQSHSLVNELMELIPVSHRRALPMLLSPLIGCSEDSIRTALLPTGSLITTGLMENSAFGYRGNTLGDNLRTTDSILSLVWEPDTADQLQKLFYQLGDPPELVEQDYAPVLPHIEVISALIGDAIDSQRQAVNVLIHGQPGSGKTQLAHLLSQSLDLDLVIVPELIVRQSTGPCPS